VNPMIYGRRKTDADSILAALSTTEPF